MPGMHGSGDLFQALQSKLSLESRVVELPGDCEQQPQTLAERVSQQLPSNKIIVLAESFSGSLIPELLKICPEKIAGVIFVASFVTSPNKILLSLTQLIPNFLLQSGVLC